MEYISFDEFKKLDIYNDFIKVNPDLGVLKIEAFTTNEGIPIPDTDIGIPSLAVKASIFNTPKSGLTLIKSS